MSDAQNAGEGSNGPGGTQDQTNGQQTTAGTGDDATKTGSGQTGVEGEGKTTEGANNAADEVKFEPKTPEGVDLDQGSLEKFTEIVKDSKLSPSERAQKLIDLAVQREADRVQSFQKTVQEWADTVAKDPELGNAENQAAARKVVEDFGTPELKSLLNSTGMGNHPEVVRFVLKVGKAMSEDAIVRARGTGASTQRDAASVLYDKTPTSN